MMHCYHCGEGIEEARGADNFPVFNMQMNSYNPTGGVVVACPHCAKILIITHIFPDNKQSIRLNVEAIN